MICAKHGIRIIGILLGRPSSCIDSYILTIRVLLFDALLVVITRTRSWMLTCRRFLRRIVLRLAPICVL
jgi:hypothetical protein